MVGYAPCHAARMGCRQYVQAIHNVMDLAKKPEIDRMCQHAQEVVLGQFNFERHAKRLLEILDEAFQEASFRVS